MIKDKIKNDITTGILGAKGSGKSVLLSYFAEGYNSKIILLDVLGVYNPKSNFKTAIVPHSYYCMDVESYLRMKDKFPKNAKIVISLEKYIDEDLINAVDMLCEQLMEDKESIALLSDEVADFMPNNAKGSKTFHRLVKNGRNYGIKPVILATQRPQSVDKSVFDLCDKFYISLQRAPRTVDYILEILDTAGNKELKKTITGLQKREFLIYDGERIEKWKVPTYKYAFKQ